MCSAEDLVGQTYKDCENGRFFKCIVIHCITHLLCCRKGLNSSCVIDPYIMSVENFIHPHGLNCHQFYKFLPEIEAEYLDLPNHTVIW